MKPEPSTIANRDWRLQAITTLAQPFNSPWTGIHHPAGSPVWATAFAKHKGRLLQFPLPNPAAMYMSLALRATTEASAGLTQISSHPFPKSAERTLSVPLSDEALFLDTLENLAASIIFSYSALEAFANSSIPDAYTYQRARDDRRCTETYSRDQIERNISLELKLHEILPSIYSVKSPKGTKTWTDFIWLKQLRDRLVHLKSEDWQSSGPDNSTTLLWSSLLHSKVPQAPAFAAAILRHYHKKDIPRWLAKLPAAK
jgi:hypothetical protein